MGRKRGERGSRGSGGYPNYYGGYEEPEYDDYEGDAYYDAASGKVVGGYSNPYDDGYGYEEESSKDWQGYDQWGTNAYDYQRY